MTRRLPVDSAVLLAPGLADRPPAPGFREVLAVLRRVAVLPVDSAALRLAAVLPVDSVVLPREEDLPVASAGLLLAADLLVASVVLLLAADLLAASVGLLPEAADLRAASADLRRRWRPLPESAATAPLRAVK